MPRRTQAEMEVIRTAIMEAVRKDRPMTVRQVFYRLVVKAMGLRDKLNDITKTEIAFHEAAHAVIALAGGHRFKYVTIEPSGKRLGHVRCESNRPELYLESEKRHRVYINLAGMVAVGLINGSDEMDLRGGMTDFTTVVGLLREEALINKTNGLLENLFHETERAIRQTKELVYEHLDIITLVAMALLEETTLSEAAVLGVCHKAGMYPCLIM